MEVRSEKRVCPVTLVLSLRGSFNRDGGVASDPVADQAQGGG
jgi:hypothetical protein